ncbi:hypothetical protein BGW37DRAFT_523860 [Umbelopsis sp. PMI_123]|jgi:hypothetical protein|nr:hypothetical protein BGW37DRAFT_523860 [Umbelopsis sp. PMI_123]
MVHDSCNRHYSPHITEDCESIAEKFAPSGLTRRVYHVPLIIWLLAGTIASIGLICGLSLFLLNGSREIAIEHEQNVIKAQTGELMGDTRHQITHVQEVPAELRESSPMLEATNSLS